ncbi:MAG: phosphoglucosamine mutase [Elusimicrobia bacterium RIFCSPLOWO2_01_FULL_64_13]|nr:MAG: phosphoglucosamine mutase [Elusimicrobia bacterium RIFCSPHIGHO2_01_FULL_64_10]OGR96692.1 MAG: phosphoglucosamine mutase [Elusimicrobia bacterium RIFCSPLOWO2_01_FULL_64_13]
MTSKRPERIFGTDGIRALAGEPPLTEDSVREIGLAAGSVLRSGRRRGKGRPKVLTGRDTRASGPWIEKALCEGLALAGCAPASCGVIPTSGVSALLTMKPRLGGAVISASHNPAEFNGIKFFDSEGGKISESLEREIESRLSAPPFRPRARPPAAAAVPHAGRDYSRFLAGTVPPGFSLKGLRWAVDCANGSASGVAPALLASFGAELEVLHASPDGHNINSGCGALHPGPLARAVRSSGADGGCAFDGDADRVQFVDDKGNLMDGDVLIAMAAEHLSRSGELAQNSVVTTVMANFGFFKRMEKLGIRVVTTPVGDRSVSEAMESDGAVLGGEQSGHVIFRKWLPTGDGILTALQILSILTASGKRLSEFTEGFEKFPQILLNLKVKRKTPVEQCGDLLEAVRRAESTLAGRGRVLVRYSGTEPLLRVMVEGGSASEIKEIARGIVERARGELC